eukprot:TRINITY_DN5233_c0_g1_i1.p1 TRINITY_DN5233_c0_g1~~TRINITY_DN5233_c0_g1_i1.p1  ORF type:complete len:564 (-),score=123.89 TRINITY_DN5233_c0_g1_i1:40-1731(-)
MTSTEVVPAASDAGRDLFRSVLGDSDKSSALGIFGISDMKAKLSSFAEQAHSAMSEGAAQMAEVAGSVASDAVESSLEQVVALREELAQFGYEMCHLEVKMSLIPEVDVEFTVHEGASLDDFHEEEEELTELQSVLLHALARKKVLDDLVQRNAMRFETVKVILSVPPSVAVRLGFTKKVGEYSDSESEEDEEDRGSVKSVKSLRSAKSSRSRRLHRSGRLTKFQESQASTALPSAAHSEVPSQAPSNAASMVPPVQPAASSTPPAVSTVPDATPTGTSTLPSTGSFHSGSGLVHAGSFHNQSPHAPALHPASSFHSADGSPPGVVRANSFNIAHAHIGGHGHSTLSHTTSFNLAHADSFRCSASNHPAQQNMTRTPSLRVSSIDSVNINEGAQADAEGCSAVVPTFGSGEVASTLAAADQLPQAAPMMQASPLAAADQLPQAVPMMQASPLAATDQLPQAAPMMQASPLAAADQLPQAAPMMQASPLAAADQLPQAAPMMQASPHAATGQPLQAAQVMQASTNSFRMSAPATSTQPLPINFVQYPSRPQPQIVYASPPTIYR